MTSDQAEKPRAYARSWPERARADSRCAHTTSAAVETTATRRDGKGSQDHAADVSPSTRAHEGEQRRTRARDAQNDERAADRGGTGERGERSGGERLLGAGSRILPVLRQLLHGRTGHDEGHPRAQHEQRSGPRPLVGRHAVARQPGGAEPLARPRPGDVEPRPPGHATAARRLGDQLLELLAVACPPRRGIPAQQPVRSPAGVHAVPPAVAIRPLRASREVPSSTIARSSASVASSASAPAGLSRYGRFLPTGPTASIRPRSSRRLIAPYSVPGPSRTPANVSMSCCRAYPCLAPDARLVRISAAGSFRSLRRAGSYQPRA